MLVKVPQFILPKNNSSQLILTKISKKKLLSRFHQVRSAVETRFLPRNWKHRRAVRKLEWCRSVCPLRVQQVSSFAWWQLGMVHKLDWISSFNHYCNRGVSSFLGVFACIQTCLLFGVLLWRTLDSQQVLYTFRNFWQVSLSRWKHHTHSLILIRSVFLTPWRFCFKLAKKRIKKKNIYILYIFKV